VAHSFDANAEFTVQYSLIESASARAGVFFTARKSTVGAGSALRAAANAAVSATQWPQGGATWYVLRLRTMEILGQLAAAPGEPKYNGSTA